MIRLALSVEGATELEFCKKILKPLLWTNNIEMTPISMNGGISLRTVNSEIKKIITNFQYVSTMYDFYGFKGNYSSLIDLESDLKDKIDSPKFIPYIQQYEFETLLFSKPSYYKGLLGYQAENEMNKIIKNFYGKIEGINDSPQTSPSKRIEQIFTNSKEQYNKVFYGYSIAEDIGLDVIRNECPRFDKWINKLMALK